MSAQPEALPIRLADRLTASIITGHDWPNTSDELLRVQVAEELRRLHAESETLRETLQRGREGWIASAEAWIRDVDSKDVLLRQALEALETDDWQKKLMAANVIRQHMEGKA